MNADRILAVLLALALSLSVSLHCMRQANADPPPKEVQRAYDTAYSALEDYLKQLVIEVRGLREDMRSLGFAGKPVSDFDGAVKKNCASCHSESSPKGKFVMVDRGGKVVVFSLNDEARIKEKLENNAMPPPPAQLSAAERELILRGKKVKP